MVNSVPMRVVIVGGGTSGWMAAAALAKVLKPELYTVSLIESDAIGTVGVGEATLPQIKDFNDFLGIDEVEFMRATQATYKMGIEFRDWGTIGNNYIHPFGAFGRPIGGVDFHHAWLKARMAGLAAPLENYSYAVAAARNERFDYPSKDARSIASTYAYAYHFDAGLYAAFLHQRAVGLGVVRHEGRIQHVDLAPDSGHIHAVSLESGQTVAGDLFIDCSGFHALLAGKTLNVGWEDWSAWLPCDRALAVPSVRTDDFSPCTRSTALEAGWQWRIPLQHRTGNGYVYASAFITDGAAADRLMGALDGDALAAPKTLRFSAGRRTSAWTRNCIAIGLASGFLEPLESTSIHLAQVAILNLIKLLPNRDMDSRLAAEFNRLLDAEYDRIRDFLILHYHANTRDDSELWRHVRHMPVPDSLREKIEAFRRRGLIPHQNEGLFSPPSWLAVMIGQDIVPHGGNPIAAGLNTDQLSKTLAALETDIRIKVAQMPLHAAFLRGHGLDNVKANA